MKERLVILPKYLKKGKYFPFHKISILLCERPRCCRCQMQNILVKFRKYVKPTFSQSSDNSYICTLEQLYL